MSINNDISKLKTHELKDYFKDLELADLSALNKSELLNIDKEEVLPPLRNGSSYYRFRQFQLIDKKIEDAFEFFSDAANLERITPEVLNFKILSMSTPSIEEGTEFIYRLKVHGIPLRWKTVICNWDPPYQFVDYQEFGPYKAWFHTHLFIEFGEKTLLVDEVKYILPFGFLGNIFAKNLVEKDINKIFEHRYDYILNKV